MKSTIFQEIHITNSLQASENRQYYSFGPFETLD